MTARSCAQDGDEVDEHSYMHQAVVLNNTGVTLYNEKVYTSALSSFERALQFRIRSFEIGKHTCGYTLPASTETRLFHLNFCILLLDPNSGTNDIFEDPFEVSHEIGLEEWSTTALLMMSAMSEYSANNLSQDFKIVYNIALVKALHRQYDIAVRLFSAAILLISRAQDFESVGVLCFHHVGRIYYRKKMFVDALVAFRHALCQAISAHAPNCTDCISNCNMLHAAGFRSRILVCCGLTHLQLNDTKQAVECCVNGWAVAHNRGKLWDEAIAAYAVGCICHVNGELLQARQHYCVLLRLAKSSSANGVQPYVFNTLQHIGNTLAEEGKFDQSLSFLLEALSMQVKFLGDENADVARTFVNVATVLSGKGAFGDSLALFTKAYNIQAKVLRGTNTEVLWTMCHMGHVFLEACDLDGALDILMAALDIVAKDQICLPFLLKTIAHVFLEKGHFKEAMTFLWQAQRSSGAHPVSSPIDKTWIKSYRLSLVASRKPSAAAA